MFVRLQLCTSPTFFLDVDLRPVQEDLGQEGSPAPVLRRPGQNVVASQARGLRNKGRLQIN